VIRTPPSNPDLLIQPRYYRQIAQALMEELVQAGFQLEDLAYDPVGTLQNRTDIVVEITDSLASGCHVAAHYDDRTSPPTILVRQGRTQGRNNFSILHELAHHAQASSDEWIELFYSLDDPRRRAQLKEAVANSVASMLLISDELLEDCIGGTSGVTARGMREMYERSSASMTACLVRSLDIPGERIVLLGTPEGGLHFSADTGTGFHSPSKKQRQSNLRVAYDKATESATESATIRGGYGIEYATAGSNTNVVFDVALCEGSVMAVVTRGNDMRHSFADKEQHVGSVCGHYFDTADASSTCRACDEPRCPQCRICGCEDKKPKACTKCHQTLYATDVSAGRIMHDECW
jgi:Zn-dependent peptidase ImmA (M78 family)